jgi:Fe-S cluster assembly ATP-binding protein
MNQIMMNVLTMDKKLEQTMNTSLLEIDNLEVRIGDKTILHGANLTIEGGTVHVIFGPNGSGKTSLVGAIMGLPQYEVTGGDIKFKGESILSLPIHERAKLGIGLAFQRPPAVKGVTLFHLLKAVKGSEDNILPAAESLNLKDYLHRDINKGFSGGEIKRSEILQLKLMDPALLMLDEPESGVDFENIVLLSDIIREMLQKELPITDRKKSGLIITHTGFIIQHIQTDVGHVILDGRILCSGNPQEILQIIRKHGFEKCVECLEKREKR